jgi:alpha/beta superfamily hydrolase
MTIIGANSVLPAVREDISLHTHDGLVLVGELALPVDQEPVATLICVHPLPTHGGMMDSHLFRKMAWRLPALTGYAVLRFNTRGTTSSRGTSDGTFDEANGEVLDLAAAVEFAQERGLPAPWLVGWSFGTDVIVKAASQVGPIAGIFLISPPLRFSTPDDLGKLRDAPYPIVALVPELDDYLPPDQARVAFAGVADVHGVAQAKHLWVGEPFVRIVMNSLTQAIQPGRMTLPDNWDGPMTRWSDV